MRQPSLTSVGNDRPHLDGPDACGRNSGCDRYGIIKVFGLYEVLTPELFF